MDSSSVVSSLSFTNHSLDFTKKSAGSSGRSNLRNSSSNNNSNNACPSAMVQKKFNPSNASDAGRRHSNDFYQHSEVSIGTDLSAERPGTCDTNSLLMRDASVLSGQPDKSNYREKLQSWTVMEDASSPFVAPRPTTSLADQKPSNLTQLELMADVEREMSFLMSRPSTSFPIKPKELVEPLEGLMPDERPVSQKKFLVLPSIGGHHRHLPSDLFLRRQRSNLETINQLDYSRETLEGDVHFFSNYYNYHANPDSPSDKRSTDDANSDVVQISPPHFFRNPRESPTKCGKSGTPMPLPPIHKMRLGGLRPNVGLAFLEEENGLGQYSRADSQLSSVSGRGDRDVTNDEDLEQYRAKTPDSGHTDSPGRSVMITPPPGFR